MNRLKLITALMILFTASLSMGQEKSSDVKLEESINLNPLGFIINGISYLEYEKMINNFTSVSFRLDHFGYNYEETETRYTYTESGSGFGLGSSVRVYTKKAEGHLKGFYGGLGMDVLSVNWEWRENDNGSIYQGSGKTTSFAIHFQTGYKFNIGKKVHIDPSLYAGYLSTDKSLGIGLVVSPALSLGVKF